MSSLVSFAAVIRVVTQWSSPLTAAHSSAAFLSLCYWEPITCMYLLTARKSYFSLHLPPKNRCAENGSLLLIGQFGERNVELEWAAVRGEDRCVATLITAAKETSLSLYCITKNLGRVVGKRVNANQGLKVNRGHNFHKNVIPAYVLCSLR